MPTLQEVVDAQVDAGLVPGAVALIDDGGDVTVATAGTRTVDGAPMTRDTLCRVASITKPITAAAAMVLVDRGRLALDDPVARWLPELADPVVLRRPDGPLDDVVPAQRPITVRHLLTLQSGHGITPDFSAPVVLRLLEELHQGPPRPQSDPPADVWMDRLGATPLVHQPGAGWTYNTGLDVLGVLLARVEDAPLGDVVRDTVLGPLGMGDTGFVIPGGAVDRTAALYGRDGDGFALVDPPDGQWTAPSPFPSGAGGLVSTADDWCAFGRMLLAGGVHAGRRVLSRDAVRQMTTSHVEADEGNPFLDGQGWGFGGGVDVAVRDPWNVVGRYGWVGGTGTAAYVIPSLDRVVVWLSQVELAGPRDVEAIGAVLTWAATQPGPGSRR